MDSIFSGSRYEEPNIWRVILLGRTERALHDKAHRYENVQTGSRPTDGPYYLKKLESMNRWQFCAAVACGIGAAGLVAISGYAPWLLPAVSVAVQRVIAGALAVQAFRSARELYLIRSPKHLDLTGHRPKIIIENPSRGYDP